MTLLLMLLLKSLLLFAVSGLLLFALRRSSAAARSLVCLLTLGALLALPLFSVALPGWHLPVLSRVQETEFTSVRQEPTPVRSSPAHPVKEGEESSQQARLAPAASDSSSSLTGRAPAKQGDRFLTQGGGFFVFYLLGLLLASVRPLLGLWGIRHLTRGCTTLTDPQTLTLVAACAHLLGLKTLPRLCHTNVPVPMTWGWHRPVVVLPHAFSDWPEDRLRSVLLHEMAHIKRRDWPAHRLADFACAVYWFHPFVWLTARRLRSETELACDDLVLASGVPAPDYARHLLEIASALPCAPGRSHTAIAMAQTSKIETRLTRILSGKRSKRTMTRGLWGVGATLALGAVLIVATEGTPPRSLMAAITSGGQTPDTPAHVRANIAYYQAQIARFGDGDPWAGKAYYLLGNAQWEAGLSTDALASFDKAILLPEPPYAGSGIHSSARYERIQTLASADRYTEAVTETQMLLRKENRGLIAADWRENLRARLPEFKMMRDIKVNRDTEQRQYRSLPASPRWTQTLSSGVIVQIVGVMRTAGTLHTAWSPDGKFLSEAKYTSDAEHGNNGSLEPVQKVLVVVRYTYPTGLAIQTEYKMSGATGTGYQSGFARNGGKVITDEDAVNPETAGRRIVEAWFPAAQTRTDLQVGASLASPPTGPENSTNAPKEWAVFSGIVLPPTQ